MPRFSAQQGRGMTIAVLAAAVIAAAATLRVVTIPSRVMQGRTWKATVLLPASYDSSQCRYPVIYFLHGYSQNYATWPKVAPLEELCDSLQCIFVCPDGDDNSWYIDSPKKTSSRFDTYIAFEVPAFIDSVFRTHATAQGRALMGSSMGGHGALSIMLRHPDRFIAAASISGILDLTHFPAQWDIADVLGQYKTNKERWKSYSVCGLLDSLGAGGRKIIIDCGQSDPALAGNRAAHWKLAAAGIEHEYRESRGGHTAQYVRSVAPMHIRSLAALLPPAGCEAGQPDN